MRIFSIILPAIVSLLVSCTTLPSPGSADGNTILVVGAIDILSKNHNGLLPTLNGHHKKGIQITLSDTESEKEFKLITDENGLFYTNKLASGIYNVLEIKYQPFTNEVDNPRPTSMSINPIPGSLSFTIEKNRVNNLGLYQWKSDGEKPEQTATEYNNGYSEVDILLNKYDSWKKWKGYEEINVHWVWKRILQQF